MEKFKFEKKVEDMTDDAVNKQQEEVMRWKAPEIRVLEFKGDLEVVNYETKELTALCPMTGIQDIYEIKISFVPDTKIPELKSLKFYFLSYWGVPIFHEHLLTKIYRDFKTYVSPLHLKIGMTVATRGGIDTSLSIGKIPKKYLN